MRVRHVKRLTPVTQMGRATENGLDEVAEAVLAPYFHETGSTPTTVGPTEPTWKTILRVDTTHAGIMCYS